MALWQCHWIRKGDQRRYSGCSLRRLDSCQKCNVSFRPECINHFFTWSRGKVVCSIPQYKYFIDSWLIQLFILPFNSYNKFFLKEVNFLGKRFMVVCSYLCRKKPYIVIQRLQNLFFTKHFSFPVIYSEEWNYFKKGWRWNIQF